MLQKNAENKNEANFSLEYSLSKENKVVKSKLSKRAKQSMESSKGKKVRVTIEVPTDSNPKAETDFTNLLKELYLKKFILGAMQKEPQAVYSNPISKGGRLKHTKEDKSHE